MSKTSKTARVNEITVTQDAARLLGGLPADRRTRARATHPVLCGMVDAFEAELCLPRFRAMPDLIAFREFLERLAAEVDEPTPLESEASDAEAMADTDAPPPADWKVEDDAVTATRPDAAAAVTEDAAEVAAALADRPRDEVAREFGDMVGATAPEDNPADDVEPTEDEWDAAEPVAEPTPEPAPVDESAPEPPAGDYMTPEERAAFEAEMAAYDPEAEAREAEMAAESDGEPPHEYRLTDETDLDVHEPTHTEPVRAPAAAAPVPAEDTYDLNTAE